MTISKQASVILDTASAGTIVGYFLGWLPHFAGILAVIWYCLQIWESVTVQGWLRRRALAKKGALQPDVSDLPQSPPVTQPTTAKLP